MYTTNQIYKLQYRHSPTKLQTSTYREHTRYPYQEKDRQRPSQQTSHHYYERRRRPYLQHNLFTNKPRPQPRLGRSPS